MRLATALAVSIGCACRRSAPDPTTYRPSSCLIEHDGGVTQCFDDIGDKAKLEGAKFCDDMHGDHTFRVATPCPTEGVLVSCTKGVGTDVERVERCYREPASCEARCAKS